MVGSGDGDGDGLVDVTVQPDRATSAAVEPSATVARHVADRQLEASMRKAPLPSARAVATESAVTVTVAPGVAPCPSTRRSPERSSARDTLTAAEADAGTASIARRSSSA